MKAILSSIVVVAGVLMTQTPGLAQTTTQDAPAATESRASDDGFDMGWIGLLGLFGLAGLTRRRRSTTDDYAGTSRTTTSR